MNYMNNMANSNDSKMKSEENLFDFPNKQTSNKKYDNTPPPTCIIIIIKKNYHCFKFFHFVIFINFLLIFC